MVSRCLVGLQPRPARRAGAINHYPNQLNEKVNYWLPILGRSRGDFGFRNKLD